MTPRIFVLFLLFESVWSFSTPHIVQKRRCSYKYLRESTSLYISSGFSYSDGHQVLVSVQKPLGMILEQEIEGVNIQVAELQADSSAQRAGIEVGDVLVAVQNVDLSEATLEEALTRIQQAPTVVNLRFVRNKEE